MDIQLGRSRTVRRAYGIDEIALVPGGRTVDPAVTDSSWSIGGINREIPIIASAMDGVVDVGMCVELARQGAMGVLNLEGVQCRYEDPNPALDRIASVGKEEFVPLMQELYSQPVREDLIRRRIAEIKERGGIAAVSATPAAALRFGTAIAESGADLFFVQATVVSTEHIGPEGQETLNLETLCRDMGVPVVIGNCVTYDVALQLMRAGAAGVMVGIGPVLPAPPVVCLASAFPRPPRWRTAPRPAMTTSTPPASTCRWSPTAASSQAVTSASAWPAAPML